MAIYCDTCGYPHDGPIPSPSEDNMAANVTAMAHLLERNERVNHSRERAARILSFAFLCLMNDPADEGTRQKAQQVYSLYARIE